MDKLQQEIIEIIEPYMDKTLSEGCLIYLNEDAESIKFLGTDDELIKPDLVELVQKYPHNSFRSMNNEHWTLIIKDCNSIQNYNVEDVEKSYIVGHYDITPIEKYIVNNGGINLKFVKGNTDYKEVWINGKTYIFPFKDPSLFTEQENKDLLELLKKLGN